MKVKVTKDAIVLYDGKEYHEGDVIDYKEPGVKALIAAGHVEQVKPKKGSK